MQEYKTAARLNPNDADTLYALGKLQYRAKLFSDAQNSFESCVTLRPDFTSAHFNRGMSLVQLGDKAKALDAFKAAVATKKDFADGYYMMGYLLRDKGDTAGALDAFKLAAQFAPDECRLPPRAGLGVHGPQRLRRRRDRRLPGHSPWTRTTPWPTTTWHR